MATIVEHKETGGVYVLLGTGFGSYHATKPNWLFGNWVADVDSGQVPVVAVCDFKGQIGWFQSSDLHVLSVDGVKPDALLAAAPDP